MFKKGIRTEAKNYRLISLLPFFSKIFEKVVHIQTEKFLNDNKILFVNQSGFRPRHSTETCLTHLTDSILEGCDKGLHTGMILIDLQKAFDTINYEILLEKMVFLRFSPPTIAWFKQRLSPRDRTAIHWYQFCFRTFYKLYKLKKASRKKSWSFGYSIYQPARCPAVFCGFVSCAV